MHNNCFYPTRKIQLACETRRRESRKGDRCRNIGCADVHTAYKSIHTSSWTFFLPRASLAFSAFISSSLSCKAFVSWSSLRFAFCTSSSSSWSSSTFFLASFSYVREGGREGRREGGKHVYSTLQGRSHRYGWYGFHRTTFSRTHAVTTGKVRRRGSITVRTIRPAASAHTCVENRIARERAVWLRRQFSSRHYRVFLMNLTTRATLRSPSDRLEKLNLCFAQREANGFVIGRSCTMMKVKM